MVCHSHLLPSYRMYFLFGLATIFIHIHRHCASSFFVYQFELDFDERQDLPWLLVDWEVWNRLWEGLGHLRKIICWWLVKSLGSNLLLEEIGN